jgi:PAS domain S-box-containing protein
VTEKESRSDQAADLRRRAEEKARAKEDQSLDTLSPDEARQVLHELRVHQIELEMQNDELRRARAELEVSRARYFDLYDLAPVGYFTVSEQGLIVEANLTAAGLLGVARGDLVERPLSRFILPEDQDIYYLHRKQLFDTGEPQVCELRMLRADAAPFWARLEATAAEDAEGAWVCRVVVSDITAHKEAEETLRQSERKYELERRYRAILDQTFGFIGLLTPDGALIEANRTALEFAGVGESDVQGKPFWETPWWTHSREMQDRLRNAIKAAVSGEFVRFEATHRAASDGQIHSVDFSLKPVRNESGEVVFLIPEGRDVTDRKRAEEGMREFETRFRDIIDNSGMGIIFVDTNAKTIFSGNQAMATLLGRSPEELAGMSIFEMHPPDAHDQVARQFEEHWIGDRQVSSNIPVIRKDGSCIYTDITSAAVTLNGVRCLSGFFRDVTERKRAEDALRESDRKLREAEAMAHLGYWRWDVTTGEVEWSKEVFKIFHLDPTTFTPHIDSIQALSPWPEDHERDRELIRRATADHEPGSYDQRFLLPDGSIGHYHSTFQGKYDGEGKLIAIVGTVLDITERKRAEDALRRSNDRLEQYAAALETANKALEESNRLAERANRAKSDFLASMSHELRTPLNAVIGFSEGLLERTDIHPLNEHQKDRLEKIKTSGEYLLQLINGVLDIAKVESGRIDLQITTFDVETVAREVGDMAEGLAKDKPAVRFILDLDERLPPMTSDRDKVRQILVNLLGNAIKFTERGSVTLRVRGNNGQLVFSVEDTGVGISAEHLNRLFEKFYQVKQETYRALKGTGLGLAISKAFATLLGGTLTVESVERQGSTFTLTIPLTFDGRKSDDLRQVVEPASVPRQSPPAGQQRPRVLCIEGNASNLMLLSDYLTEAGYQVVPAANGSEGLRLAAAEHPQAIILDVMLPGQDGWGILYRLKAHPATSDIPVIIATGLEEQRLGLLLGANDYLVKPIAKSRLLQAIRRVSLDPARHIKNVAIVDDDLNMLQLAACILEREHYTVWTFESGEAFLASLATQKPDIVIVDLLMPHMDGFQLIETLREHPTCSDVPVVIMTAKVLSEDDLAQLSHCVCAVIQKDGTICEEALHQLVAQVQLMEAGREQYADSSAG